MPLSNTAAIRPVVKIRESLETDMATVAQIYSKHVLEGLATFEETPPDVETMTARRAGLVSANFPYLVATDEADRVVGYAYASLYRSRTAYRYTLEDSIYVASGLEGRGIGRKLLTELIVRCEAGPWRQMIAVIGDSANERSVALHAALGFVRSCTLVSVGFKFGRWVDSVLMQRALGEGNRTPPPPIPPT